MYLSGSTSLFQSVTPGGSNTYRILHADVDVAHTRILSISSQSTSCESAPIALLAEQMCLHSILLGRSPVQYPFEADKLYSRKNVLEIVGVSDPKGGNWYTGYVSHGNDFFIFCNVGTAGRTGHDYANCWDGSDLIWYAKTRTHVAQSTMQRLLDGTRGVYIFWRSDNSERFIFAGLAKPVRVATTIPVRVRWTLVRETSTSGVTSPGAQPLPSQALLNQRQGHSKHDIDTKCSESAQH